MPRPLRCPCGRTNRTAENAILCRTCGRLLTRSVVDRRWVIAGVAVVAVAATVFGGFALRAKSPPDPPQPTAPVVASVRSEPLPRSGGPAPPVAQTPPADQSVEQVVVPAPAASPPVAGPPQPPPIPVRPPAALVGQLMPVMASRYRVGEVIVQEVTLTRQSGVRILGAGAPQTSQYTLLSHLTVEAIGPDGSLGVRQRVEATRLGASDPVTRGGLEDALRKAKGATFEIAVGPGGEVTGLKGPNDPVRVHAANDPTGGQSFRIWSLLDVDGWKELAGLTFFQPGRPLVAGQKWARPLNHTWGELGSWSGRTHYTAAGRRDGAERIEFAHEMSYRPPAGEGGMLPVRILRAEFTPQAAGGVIRYDAANGRVTAAEEVFRVRGALLVSAGGIEAPVEMEESQGFQVKILGPADQVLRGATPPVRR